MTSTTTSHGSVSEPDLQLPGHRYELRRPSPAAIRMIGASVGALGGALVGALYLIAGPLIGFATGLGQIIMEIRENAVRPRPFVGRRHGFPFLDPLLPVVAIVPTDVTEE
jgi:hypothetical protein